MELHALLQVEGPGELVLGYGPAFRQVAYHGAVILKLQKGVVEHLYHLFGGGVVLDLGVQGLDVSVEGVYKGILVFAIRRFALGCIAAGAGAFLGGGGAGAAGKDGQHHSQAKDKGQQFLHLFFISFTS